MHLFHSETLDDEKSELVSALGICHMVVILLKNCSSNSIPARAHPKERPHLATGFSLYRFQRECLAQSCKAAKTIWILENRADALKRILSASCTSDRFFSVLHDQSPVLLGQIWGDLLRTWPASRLTLRSNRNVEWSHRWKSALLVLPDHAADRLNRWCRQPTTDRDPTR